MSTVKAKRRMLIKKEYMTSFFTVDAEGRELNLGQYIQLQKEYRMRKEEIAGLPNAQHNPILNNYRQPTFNDSQIRKLVDRYLESMDDDVVLVIEGKSFSATQLKQEVCDHTYVGQQFLAMILADRRHVESLINDQNYTLEPDNE